jgi:hypothetical protein
MNWENCGNWMSMLLMLSSGIAGLYFIYKGKPSSDPCGQWKAEVMLTSKDTKLIVLRDRYGSAREAERAAEIYAKKLCKRFIKAQPWRKNQVYATKEYGDVSITWRTIHVEDLGFDWITPVDIYGLK